MTDTTTATAFAKTVRLGTRPRYPSGRMDVYAKIEWDGRELSITGVEGPRSNGDAFGSSGQIVMSYGEPDAFDGFEPAPGWTLESVRRFFALWDRWHLNKMRAGSPAQSKWLRDHAADWEAAKADRERWSRENGGRGYPDHYTWAREELTKAGLQPDHSHPVNGKPYSYGSAWLSEEVPPEVLAELEAFPSTDRAPAWV
jgi:hypothetical protein